MSSDDVLSEAKDVVASGAAVLPESNNNGGASDGSRVESSGSPVLSNTSPPSSSAVVDSGASASLYVGDLHSDITEQHLHEIFQALGPLSSIRVCRDQVTRRSLGYAYVNFHNMQDAVNALDTMNYHASSLTKGKAMRIMWKHRDPSARKQGQGNIYVKGLDKSIDNKCLYDTFSQFGKIMSCKVATDEGGMSLGYGFVHFETPESAKTATENVNGMMLAGRQVFVGPFLNKKQREASGQINRSFTNVYVKNLDPSVCTEADIRAMFQDYGGITSLFIPVDESSVPKGFAFINFESADMARLACDEINGKSIEGKVLFVGRAQKKSEREMQLRSKFEAMKLERMQKLQGVNLYVKNLSDDMDDDKLRCEFEEFGTITSCKIMRDDKGQSRGFGFVCFTQPEEATKAVTGLNGRMIASKPIYVALAQRKETRRAQLEIQRNIGQMRLSGPGLGAQTGMYASPASYVFQQAGVSPQISTGVPAGRGGGFMNPQYVALGRGGHMSGRGTAGVPMNTQYVPVGRGQPAGQLNQSTMAAFGMTPRHSRQSRQRAGPVSSTNPVPSSRGSGPSSSVNPQQFKYPLSTRSMVSSHDPASVATESPPQLPGSSVLGASTHDSGRGQSLSNGPLTVEQLSAASSSEQKQLLGEKLFPLIAERESALAGKITGMLLEMENTDILHLIDTPEALNEQVSEALRVLMEHQGVSESAPNSTAGESRSQPQQAV